MNNNIYVKRTNVLHYTVVLFHINKSLYIVPMQIFAEITIGLVTEI